MVKLIDYGRSYFSDKKHKLSSEVLASNIKYETNDCFADGRAIGFWFDEPYFSHNQIWTMRANWSIDLICAHSFLYLLPKIIPEMKELRNRINDRQWHLPPTKSVANFDPRISPINNVLDMRDALIALLVDGVLNHLIKHNPHLPGCKRFGTLTIYTDVDDTRDMTWAP